jgi:hypothetical protein
VIALWKLARLLGPGALELLVDLTKAALEGASPSVIARRAEKLAHRVAFERALREARRG